MTNDLIIFTSPNTWNELRILYESGEYANLEALYEKQKCFFSDMPSLHEIKDRCHDECWDKDRFQEVKAELKRRKLAELYAKLGMDSVEQAKYRIECVKAVDDVKEIIGKLYRMLEYLDPESRKFTETLGKIKVLTDTMLKGMNTSLAALQDISKLTGDYAPVSTKEVHGHGYKTKDGIKGIEDMSEEEILQDLKRMQRAGIDINNIIPSDSSPDAQGGPNAT